MWEKKPLRHFVFTTNKNNMTKKASKAKVKPTAVETKNNGTEVKKIYSVAEAVAFVKKESKVKFDASIEVHFRLGIDPRKGDQQVRSAVSLPHGTGKTVKIAAFVTPGKEEEARKAGADIVGGEDLINQIKTTEKTDFQVAIAEPMMMKNLAPIAKILGTRGLMPSPKNETVTPNIAKAIEELKKGKISFKNDDTGNIHAVIGRVSFTDEQLTENFTAVYTAVKKIKPTTSKGLYFKNISVNATMGKGVKVSV